MLVRVRNKENEREILREDSARLSCLFECKNGLFSPRPETAICFEPSNEIELELSEL
jgi:hypothetical protein